MSLPTGTTPADALPQIFRLPPGVSQALFGTVRYIDGVLMRGNIVRLIGNPEIQQHFRNAITGDVKDRNRARVVVRIPFKPIHPVPLEAYVSGASDHSGPAVFDLPQGTDYNCLGFVLGLNHPVHLNVTNQIVGIVRVGGQNVGQISLRPQGQGAPIIYWPEDTLNPVGDFHWAAFVSVNFEGYPPISSFAAKRGLSDLEIYVGFEEGEVAEFIRRIYNYGGPSYNLSLERV